MQVKERKNTPSTIQHLQKLFKLTVKDSFPQVTVETMGKGRWLMCCPLCGCQHQILGVDETLPYTPLRQAKPLLYKAEVSAWRKLNPEDAKYVKLHLMRNVTG